MLARRAQTVDGEIFLRPVDERDPYRFSSLTKKTSPASEYSAPPSARRSPSEGAHSRGVISACSAATRPVGQNTEIHLRTIESPTPRSDATHRRESLLLGANRTASRSESSAYFIIPPNSSVGVQLPGHRRQSVAIPNIQAASRRAWPSRNTIW